MLCVTNNSIKHQSFVYIQLNDQTVLFWTIQFSINHSFAHSLNVQNSSIWPMGKTLSGATTPGLSGPGSNGNERVLHIPQSSRTGASPSDAGHSLGVESYLSDTVGVFYSPSWLGLDLSWFSET